MERLTDVAPVLSLDTESQTSILALAPHTAQPEQVFERLSQFCQTHKENRPHLDRLSRALADPVRRQGIILTFGNSPYLSQLIQKWPAFLEEPTADNPLVPAKEQWVENLLQNAPSHQEAESLIRLTKQRAYLWLGMRDLNGEATLQEVVQTLSDLADTCLEGAYRWLDRWLTKQHGRPMVGSPPRPARFTILGMGKLGAQELNFSSDVDLIYLYDEDEGKTEGPRVIGIKQYYSRLGRELIQLLEKFTADGRAFRVDLRLRPEGESGDLALSTRSAEIYYESWGQTWERSAMIKARPVAGDLELGQHFLNNVRPFVFRRYLDFTALDAIREMKRKIDRKMAGAMDYRTNVKLGYGGIREIEFFVQCHQLIHGGKNPELRHRETLVTLHRLVDHGLLAPEDASFLAEAYRFLRTIEHRLQMEWEKQTHSLPEDPQLFEQLARRAGYETGERLKNQLTYYTDGVHTLYGQLFFEGEKQTLEESESQLTTLLACNPEQKSCLEFLEKSGFTNPEQTTRLLTTLREGPRGMALTEHDRLWYDRVTVPLLSEILHAPDQDLAMQHSEAFLARLGHRVSYLAMMVENPPILKLLVRLFGTSPLLSRFLIQHPELMDRLSVVDFFARSPHKDELIHSLQDFLADTTDPEIRFDRLREFKQIESLRLGIGDLAGTVELQEVMGGLSHLAEVVLQQVLEDAWLELTQRHGVPQSEEENHPVAPFAIIAMGKLGGGELNYSSDLDLIFLHGGEGYNLMTKGDHPIANHLFFTRLGQKIITNITVMTQAGKLYELDMRLRPSGKSGPLVTHWQSFVHYQENDAWTWEHQALTRAKAISGEPWFIQKIHQMIQAILCQPREIPPLRQEVVQMRERMYAEKKPQKGWVDIKQSRGGIVDIEFLVQFLILAHGHESPQLLQRNTSRAIHAVRTVGLLEEEACSTLEEAYAFYRLVENRLRLLHDRSENRIGPDGAVQRRLHRLCGLPPEDRVVDLLHRWFEAVYPIYTATLQPENP